MMRVFFKIILLLFAVAGCSDGKKIGLPEDALAVDLEMVTEGGSDFSHYIHSLTVYAFRRDNSGEYVFDRVLADLDSVGVAGLESRTDRGDSKVLPVELAFGTYKLCFVANARAEAAGGGPMEGVTPVSGLVVKGLSGGEKESWFGESLDVRVAGQAQNVSVKLTRQVSKVVVVLYGVPEEVAAIGLSLGNIAAEVAVDGTPGTDTMRVEKWFPLGIASAPRSDTVVLEVLTFPTVGEISPFSLIFRSVSGEERTKVMPGVKLLPDKYIRIPGIISREPGGALSFSVTLGLFIFDDWRETSLPGFILTPTGV